MASNQASHPLRGTETKEKIMKKLVNGHVVEFVVELKNFHPFFPKLINVSLNGRFGLASDWVEALAMAREYAELETELHVMQNTTEYKDFPNYVKSGKWESECFTEMECA